MIPPAQSLRILFADDEAETRHYLQELLTRLGHKAFTVSTGRELVELTSQVEPDLIIVDVIMPDTGGVQAVEQINQKREIPAILVTGSQDPAVLTHVGTGNVLGFLIKPVTEADVRAAIAVAMLRFQQYQNACKETSELRQALENRKLLERAKGAVMKRLRVAEDTAFRLMKKVASTSNRKLTDVAAEIVGSEQVFYRLEQQNEMPFSMR